MKQIKKNIKKDLTDILLDKKKYILIPTIFVLIITNILLLSQEKIYKVSFVLEKIDNYNFDYLSLYYSILDKFNTKTDQEFIKILKKKNINQKNFIKNFQIESQNNKNQVKALIASYKTNDLKSAEIYVYDLIKKTNNQLINDFNNYIKEKTKIKTKRDAEYLVRSLSELEQELNVLVMRNNSKNRLFSHKKKLLEEEILHIHNIKIKKLEESLNVAEEEILNIHNSKIKMLEESLNIARELNIEANISLQNNFGLTKFLSNSKAVEKEIYNLKKKNKRQILNESTEYANFNSKFKENAFVIKNQIKVEKEIFKFIDLEKRKIIKNLQDDLYNVISNSQLSISDNFYKINKSSLLVENLYSLENILKKNILILIISIIVTILSVVYSQRKLLNI